jgi:hypothetical protein
MPGILPGARPRELGAHALLLLGEALQRHFQIRRQEGLHRVAVEADQLAEELDRQQVLAAAAVFLFEDDLGQDRAGDVVVGLGVIDHEVDALLHHVRQVFEGDVRGRRCVVEATVGVFLDDRRADRQPFRHAGGRFAVFRVLGHFVP